MNTAQVIQQLRSEGLSKGDATALVQRTGADMAIMAFKAARAIKIEYGDQAGARSAELQAADWTVARSDLAGRKLGLAYTAFQKNVNKVVAGVAFLLSSPDNIVVTQPDPQPLRIPSASKRRR